MQRILIISLVGALLLIGALHYAPLWIFVLAIPLWMVIYLETEERRIRAEVVDRVRERLLSSREDD